MGALTSKVYSFSLRPWELKVVETFDFIDSWVSPIFLNLRGLKIVRVLPRVVGFNVDSFWISDKTRFFFDALTTFRVQIPSIFYKRIKYDVSWYKVSNFLNFIFLKIFCLNINVSFNFLINYIGDIFYFRSRSFLNLIYFKNNIFDFEDLKTNFYKNFFYNLFWFDKFYNFQIYTSRKNYFLGNNLNENFINLKYIFLINTNLRFEFPILLLLLRKLVNLGYSEVFFWGERFFSCFNFFFTFMGINFIEFFNFIKGKHIYSYLLFENYLFFLDETLRFRSDFKNLFSFLFYKNFHFKLLNCNIGSLNFFDFGDLYGSNFINKKIGSTMVNFCDNKSINSFNDFNIFVNSHLDKSFFNFDVILPVATGYESSLLTNNIFGEKKKIDRILKFENSDVRPTWKIFESFLFKFLDIFNSVRFRKVFFRDVYCDLLVYNYIEHKGKVAFYTDFGEVFFYYDFIEFYYRIEYFNLYNYEICYNFEYNFNLFYNSFLDSANFLKDLMRSSYLSLNFCYNNIEIRKPFFFFNTLMESFLKRYRDLNSITQLSKILGLIDKFSAKYSFNFFKFK